MKTIFALTILIIYATLLPPPAFGQKPETAQKIVNDIIKKTKAASIEGTVDVFKAGDPGTLVSGIATCMFCTMDVLKQAVDKNCNLIITHEPIYYNHLDETQSFTHDSVFLEKQKFIQDHGLVIWRFHDYIHSMKPDGILRGMARKLDWEKYAADKKLEQYTFPEMSLKQLLENLKKVFPQYKFNVVGEPNMKLTNVWLAPGAPGSATHIQILERADADVVITGESEQWETYEYVRDAVSQHRNKAVIFLGHIPSEESGMKFCAEWLKGFIKDTPVYFIPCGSSYMTF